MTKTCLCIHDISCLGKCSLTAALPVLSAAGVDVGLLPTALLSTQTGGLNDYTYLDLTDEMEKIVNHFVRLNRTFDCIYSGFLGSDRQIEIVSRAVDLLSNENTLFVCDPAMADNGCMYNSFDVSFIESMKRLCKRADVIVPNVTEAFMLLDEPYEQCLVTSSEARGLLERLLDRYELKVSCITGITDGDKIGTAVLFDNGNSFYTSMQPRQKSMFHSTGDLFASSFVGCLQNDLSIERSTDIAVKFVSDSIAESVRVNRDSRFGLEFEKCLRSYIDNIEVAKNEQREYKKGSQCRACRA